jgi:hypothetical protein
MLLRLISMILLFTFEIALLLVGQAYSQVGNCDPAYPDFCIASPPPDLNCPEVPEDGFRVLAPDPHGFDRDVDGVGCES